MRYPERRLIARNHHLYLCIDHVGPFVLRRMAGSLLQMVRAFYDLNIMLTNS
jgi:hypothetical protein